MADVKSLEHPTLKVCSKNTKKNLTFWRRISQVPYEILNKKFRTAQKTLDREVAHVQQAALEIERGIAGNNIQTKDITSLLGGMVEKLQALKRKAEESISEGLQASNVCKRRIEHLKEHGSHSHSGVSQAALNQWKTKRLDRMVVEYFLRNGYYNAAITLAEKSNVKDLTNIGKYRFLCIYGIILNLSLKNIMDNSYVWSNQTDIFLTSREVEKSLANRETLKCLNWCYDNRSKLRKLKSNMEFNLRIQEFVELIRSDRRMDAIKHSRKHFPSFEEEHLGVIQQVMALLAFPISTGQNQSSREVEFVV